MVSVFVFYCWVLNHSKLNKLKQSLYSGSQSVGQKSSWSKSRLRVSEGQHQCVSWAVFLSGAQGPSKLPRLYQYAVLCSCRAEVLLPSWLLARGCPQLLEASVFLAMWLPPSSKPVTLPPSIKSLSSLKRVWPERAPSFFGARLIRSGPPTVISLF